MRNPHADSQSNTKSSGVTAGDAAPVASSDVEVSAFEALPLEMQLLIVEQLDYKTLKRLQRVSKSMQALVSTRSVALDKILWRTRYSAEALQAEVATHKAKGKEFVPTLHPILGALHIKGGITFEQIRVGRYAVRLLCANAQILEENASFPPTLTACFEGSISHRCANATKSSEDSCTTHHWTPLVADVPLTVKAFVRGFLDSMDDACADFKEKIEGKAFQGWDAKTYDEEQSDFAFEEPQWEGVYDESEEEEEEDSDAEDEDEYGIDAPQCGFRKTGFCLMKAEAGRCLRCEILNGETNGWAQCDGW